MSINANYAGTPKNGVILVGGTANSNRDGTTGTYYTLITGAASGTRVDDISIRAIGTTTAGMLRIFLHNGTSGFLIGEIAVTAITPSATVKAWAADLLNESTILQNASWSIRISTEKAESFHASVTRAGDF
jgi:hypothetical protein